MKRGSELVENKVIFAVPNLHWQLLSPDRCMAYVTFMKGVVDQWTITTYIHHACWIIPAGRCVTRLLRLRPQ